MLFQSLGKLFRQFVSKCIYKQHIGFRFLSGSLFSENAGILRNQFLKLVGHVFYPGLVKELDHGFYNFLVFLGLYGSQCFSHVLIDVKPLGSVVILDGINRNSGIGFLRFGSHLH